MPNITADQFLPDIRPEADRCPDPILERRLRETIIDLCEEAPLWVMDFDITLIVDESDYRLPAPEMSDIHSILGLWIGNRSLDAASHHDLRDEPGRIGYRELQGSRVYSVPERGLIRIHGAPSEATVRETMRAFVSLKPTRDATEYPDLLSENYHDGIVHGAIGRALMMTGRTWSNSELATYHRRMYFECQTMARQAADRGRVTGPLRPKPNRFAPGRRFYS